MVLLDSAAEFDIDLYTASQMRILGVGDPVNERDDSDGKSRIRFGMLRSTDIETWTPTVPGEEYLRIFDGKTEVDLGSGGRFLVFTVLPDEIELPLMDYHTNQKT